MKTSLVALLLVLANLASGQNAAAPQPQASQPQASPAQPQTQKKEIKDPAEYNAYVGAVQQSGSRLPRSAAWKLSSPSIPTA